ncbi:hypothetical protein [Moraxella lacunata]
MMLLFYNIMDKYVGGNHIRPKINILSQGKCNLPLQIHPKA